MLSGFTMPKAYSYTRFSTPEQAAGDSQRRQMEEARRFAERHGLVLDQSVEFRDEGISAFKGKNAKVGALARFRRAVEDGEIEEGSWLIVENLDRLSRDNPLSAMNLLSEIVGYGITVGIPSDGQVYNKRRLQEEPACLFYILASALRANDESRMKARRLSAAWSAKRERAEVAPLTGKCPAWLKLSDDRSRFELIPERTAVVRRIFDLAASGVGVHSIASTLNEAKIETFGQAQFWHRSYIKKILESEATIGIFTPHTVENVDGRRRRIPQKPVKDYFPPVVDENVWLQVRARSMTTGRRASPSAAMIKNPFAGVLRCGRCGAAMTRINKGSGYETLACTKKRAKAGCDAPDIPMGIAWHSVKCDAPRFLIEDASDPTVNRLNELEEKIEATREMAHNLADQIARSPSPTLTQRLSSFEDELRLMEAQYRELLISVEGAPGRRERMTDELLEAIERDDFQATALALRGLGIVLTMERAEVGIHWHWERAT